MSMLQVRSFFDEMTHTVSYLIWDETSKQGAVIDPVLTFELDSQTTSIQAITPIINEINQHQIQLKWILETVPLSQLSFTQSYSRQLSKNGMSQNKNSIPLS